MQFPTTGLYAITQTEDKTEQQIIDAVGAALTGGVAILQYRHKQKTESNALASALLELCHKHSVPMIINDDINLVANIGADGVHLGKTDGTIEQARNILGTSAIIGVSCYNSVTRALAAEQQHASYVAFGRFFTSGSKPLAALADIATLIKAKTKLRLPIVAIGGILPDNGRPLIDAGANLLAVIGGLFDNDAELAARAYCALFEK